eukprot:Anaeramoba_flamelloidesa326126_23.p2 GENE.a326126_23~~a326126_23.p2  ORF type:complete len:105 (-),score=15.76 a326126_23:719-1033(-)
MKMLSSSMLCSKYLKGAIIERWNFRRLNNLFFKKRIFSSRSFFSLVNSFLKNPSWLFFSSNFGILHFFLLHNSIKHLNMIWLWEFTTSEMILKKWLWTYLIYKI